MGRKVDFGDFDDSMEDPFSPPSRAPARAPARQPPPSRAPTQPSRVPRMTAAATPATPLMPAKASKKKSSKKSSNTAVNKKMVGLGVGGVAAVACIGMFVFRGGSSNGGLPENVLVTGCGLGNRLMTVGNFYEAGADEGVSAGVLWTTGATMAAQWSDLFKTPLPHAVTPDDLKAVNYRWTSTEYAPDPLATKTSATGKVFKSTTGHYAEVAALDDGKFVSLTADVKPRSGGWGGLRAAKAAADLAAGPGTVAVSVGCLARKFGKSPTGPTSFLRTLQPIDEIQALVDNVAAEMQAKKESGACKRVIGLHLRRGDIERATDKRHNEVMTDAMVTAALQTWPANYCFFIATDKHAMIGVVEAAVGAARVFSVKSAAAAAPPSGAEEGVADEAPTALSTAMKLGDMDNRKEKHGMQLAVADMFALGKADEIIAQPTSTYSVTAAWISDSHFTEMTPTFVSQNATCVGIEAGKWGKRNGLHYPVKCWIPAPDGVVETGGDAAPDIGNSGKAVASNPPLPQEEALCASQNGILVMPNGLEGVCCPMTCGSTCGSFGCGKPGGGGGAACCKGKINKIAKACDSMATGTLLTDTGCVMKTSAEWTVGVGGTAMPAAGKALGPPGAPPGAPPRTFGAPPPAFGAPPRAPPVAPPRLAPPVMETGTAQSQ